MKAIIAKKLNMTQVFTEDGTQLPVTVLQASPVKVSQIKTADKDGYEAVQVSRGRVKREFRGQTEDLKVDSEIDVSVFKPGDLVKLTGTTKGRGFAGVIRRHGFHGAPASHGHPHQRVAGSIGSMFPQHVRKGTRMPGQMGARTATETNLLVVAVDPAKNLLFVKGSVPGGRDTLVQVVKTGAKEEAPKIMEYGKPREQQAKQTEAPETEAEPQEEQQKAAEDKAKDKQRVSK